MAVDHRELLKKYMRHVIDCEGVDFLVHAAVGGSSQHEVAFTEEEIERLEEISAEVCEAQS